MNPVFVIAGIIGFVALIALVIALGIYSGRKRRQAMEELAQSLGFTFTPQPPIESVSSIRQFKLMQAGRRQQVINLMQGSTESTQVLIFDWSYVTGSGKHSHTHTSTLVAIQSDDLHVPAFLCRPESLLDWIGLTFDGRDIDFEDQPLFSKRYHLHGSAESRIRQYFDRTLCEFLEQRIGSYVEANGDRLIYCRDQRTSEPAKIRELFQDAFRLYVLLKGEPATESGPTISDQSRDEMPPETERQF